MLSSLKPYIKKGSTFAVLGGEPLLRPKETIECCKVAKKFGLIPIISANGTLITDAFAKSVRRYNIELQA